MTGELVLGGVRSAGVAIAVQFEVDEGASMVLQVCGSEAACGGCMQVCGSEAASIVPACGGCCRCVVVRLHQ